jgi:cytochrome c oxidase assembly factor CtaG
MEDGLSIIILIIYLILILLAIGFFWKMLIDCFKNEEGGSRVGWILFIICLNVFGAIIYYFARYKTRSKYKKLY